MFPLFTGVLPGAVLGVELESRLKKRISHRVYEESRQSCAQLHMLFVVVTLVILASFFAETERYPSRMIAFLRTWHRALMFISSKNLFLSFARVIPPSSEFISSIQCSRSATSSEANRLSSYPTSVTFLFLPLFCRLLVSGDAFSMLIPNRFKKYWEHMTCWDTFTKVSEKRVSWGCSTYSLLESCPMNPAADSRRIRHKQFLLSA